jgi:hypothetical protein
MYQFVPLLKSKEWPISKIYKLAQLHVSIVEGLRPLFITKLQDINNVINAEGNSLMQGFYCMTVPPDLQSESGITPPSQLIHSIHNTNRNTIKAVLVHYTKFDSAVDQLSNIANILKSHIHREFHNNVFVPDTEPALVGHRADSVPSCNYSSYATALLNNFNPQDGENPASISMAKRVKSIHITYAQAAAFPSPIQQLQASLSTLTDMDKLYDLMSTKFGEQFGSKVSIQDLKKQVTKTSLEINTIQTNFELQLTSIQSSVDQLTTKVNTQYSEINATVQTLVETIEKQNFIIAGIQQEFKLSIETLTSKIVSQHAPTYHTSSTSSQRRSIELG